MNLWIIFLTGLTVGGVGCLAVQGGLLASTISAREEEEIEEGSKRKHGIWPTAAFLITKLGAYLILGFILGGFGAGLQISDNVRAWMQLIAGIYMLAVALNLLNVHPIFRYVIIQPPRFLIKLVRNQSKSKDLFAPALLGALTIFIPCGTTLAMEALAISSGNALTGAAILGVFVLGTSPLFFVLGYITTALGDAFRMRFLKIAGFLVIYLGLTSINGALVLMDSPIQISFGGGEDVQGAQGDTANVTIIGGVQVAEISALSNGYSPNYIKVKKDLPVRLNLTAKGYGCTSSVVIPSLGIRKSLTQNTAVPIEFTPTNTGKITWTCSMGMYSGVIEVI